MVDKKLRLAVLNDARKTLEENNLQASDRATLLKLLDLLILATEFHVSPEKMEAETRGLAGNLISSQSLLALVKQQSEELDALKKLSLNLTSSLDLPTVLEAVVREALRLVPRTRTVHIFLYIDKQLKFGASLDSSGVQNRVFSEPRQEGLTYTVARHGKTIIVENMRTHPLYQNAPKDWEGSIVGIPLKIDSRVVGVMNLSKSMVGGFTQAEIHLLTMLADQAAVAISNARLLQQLSTKAYSDTTTGLPNRRALDERIEAEVVNARRTSSPFAVIMMDLDGFKNVNDTHGHDVGDLVLRAVFNVIASSIRSSDFIARYGGDEMTLILSNSTLQSARLVSEKILENLRKFSYKAPDGSLVRLGISGGIALFPQHGRTSPELLRAADAALYHAKKHQRGTFAVAKAATGPLNPLALTNHKKNGG